MRSNKLRRIVNGDVKIALVLSGIGFVLANPMWAVAADENSIDEEQVVEIEINDQVSSSEEIEHQPSPETNESAQSVASSNSSTDSDESESDGAEKSLETPDIFIPSEDISEDYAVPFPVDI